MQYQKDKKIKKLYSKSLIFAFFVTLVIVLGALWFFYPSKLTYGYGSDNCVTRPTLLPGFYKNKESDVLVEYRSVYKMAGRPVMAKDICIFLKQLPGEGEQRVIAESLFGVKLLSQRIIVKSDSYPRVTVEQQSLKKVSVNGNLDFELEQPDKYFKYSLKNEIKDIDCENKLSQVSCSLESLNLKHATNYRAKVIRTYGQSTVPVMAIDFTTVEPINIIGTSLPADGRVLSRLTEVVIKTDKLLQDLGDIQVLTGADKIDISTKIAGNDIIITLPDNLPRETTYKLLIPSLIGKAKESLPDPYESEFYLTPGPKLTGWSLGDRKTPRAGGFAVYFNQKLGQQDLTGKIKLFQNSNEVPFSTAIKGSYVYVYPNVDFSACAEIKLQVNGDINNSYGISSNLNWSATSRVECATSFIVGKSVQGRSIVGYSFGNGAKEILFIGAIHGNEQNSKAILDKWLYELEGNPSRIPAGTKVTVIPLVNPDGYARASRYNANSVDLNRNFGANNWKADITIQGGSVMVNGGGTSP